MSRRDASVCISFAALDLKIKNTQALRNNDSLAGMSDRYQYKKSFIPCIKICLVVYQKSAVPSNLLGD